MWLTQNMTAGNSDGRGEGLACTRFLVRVQFGRKQRASDEAICALHFRSAWGKEKAMRDYLEAVRNFSAVELEKKVLQGSLSTGVNACVECCDCWAKDGAVALEWYGASGQRKTVTFAQMRVDRARFASFLKSRGIGAGDGVAGLLPRIPDLFAVILGAWRIGALYQPLFTAFGPAAVESRVTAEGGSKAKLIVTDTANLPKLKDVPDCPPTLVVGRRLRRDACHAINRLRAGHD